MQPVVVLSMSSGQLKYIVLSFQTMKPVTHHITPFTIDRVDSIRLLREVRFLEFTTGSKTKKKGTLKSKGQGRKGKGKTKKVELTAKSREALAGLDPETRAFLEANM